MSELFAWAAVFMAGAAALTLGISVSGNFQRAALIQGGLGLGFLVVFLALTYLPPV